jgi:hypothetical protein
MNEKSLWHWLKAQVEPKGWHIIRVETNTQLGVPDVNYCSPSGMEGWVELKYAHRWPPSHKPPFSMANQHKMTDQQEYFLTKRHQNNSCSGVLAQVGTDKFFISAAYAAEFNSLTKEQFFEYNILEQWLNEG